MLRIVAEWQQSQWEVAWINCYAPVYDVSTKHFYEPFLTLKNNSHMMTHQVEVSLLLFYKYMKEREYFPWHYE